METSNAMSGLALLMNEEVWSGFKRRVSDIKEAEFEKEEKRSRSSTERTETS